jgi:flagellar hook-basal body complex protein FliE
VSPIGAPGAVQSISVPNFFPAVPDDAAAVSASADPSFGALVRRAFGETSAALDRADAAERAFARGRGGLQEMVLERAQADVTLSIASAAAARTAQALTTILGMQI